MAVQLVQHRLPADMNNAIGQPINDMWCDSVYSFEPKDIMLITPLRSYLLNLISMTCNVTSLFSQSQAPDTLFCGGASWTCRNK
jgi:hypothetical protein